MDIDQLSYLLARLVEPKVGQAYCLGRDLESIEFERDVEGKWFANFPNYSHPRLLYSPVEDSIAKKLIYDDIKGLDIVDLEDVVTNLKEALEDLDEELFRIDRDKERFQKLLDTVDKMVKQQHGMPVEEES